MLHCKFSGDYNSERIFKIGQYLTKLCVEHLGFTFLAHPVHVYNASMSRRAYTNKLHSKESCSKNSPMKNTTCKFCRIRSHNIRSTVALAGRRLAGGWWAGGGVVGMRCLRANDQTLQWHRMIAGSWWRFAPIQGFFSIFNYFHAQIGDIFIVQSEVWWAKFEISLMFFCVYCLRQQVL